MSELEITQIGLIMAGAGIWLFFTGLKDRKQRQLIENTPTSKVRSIAMGPVELKGKVKRADDDLYSPIRKVPCVYYKFLIEEYHEDKDGHGSWRNVKQEQKGVNFFLEDDTGKVLVNPKKAEVEIPHDYRRDNRSGNLSKEIIDYCEEIKFPVKGLFGLFKRQLRFTEYALEVNNDIYLLGTAKDNPNVEFTEKGTENIIIEKAGNFFFISDKSEKELLKAKGNGALYLVLGSILIPLGLGLMAWDVFVLSKMQ